MSVAQIKRELKGLSARQRADVKSFLEQFPEADETVWLAEMERRINEMKTGKAITRTELRRQLGVMD
jgi:hypothetical protein